MSTITRAHVLAPMLLAGLALAGSATGTAKAGPDEPVAGHDDGAGELAVVTTSTEPDGDELSDLAAASCTALDPELLDVHVLGSGAIRFVYADDGLVTCDEVMVVTSYASAGPVVDNHHDPVVDQIVFQVAELEAAGPPGITVEPELDECWAGLEVARDGDTLVWDDVLGDGCSMQITSDFAGTPFPTEIHVVQQSGNIEPPHIFGHDQDETTVLTGLPNGTWYVKVYEGAHPATTMAVDGAAAALTSIVHGVPDGSEVEIGHPDPGPRSSGDFVLAARR